MSDNSSRQDSGVPHRVHGTEADASFQVVVLGANGGPREDTVTGLLVRAPQSEWRKNSVIAVDAGVHLSSIIAILQEYMPRTSAKLPEPGYSRTLDVGPFAGLSFPHISAKANALHIFRELLSSFLITHPHLDHIAAMGINTPALEYGKGAKTIVALPPTIDAIKSHIFNDSIWPNLSDENHGVGFVTYRRLVEGGNPRLGSGESRGYINVCDGLAAKCWSVSHGKCQRRHHSLSHQRGESSGWFPNDYAFPPRRLSRMSDDHGYFAAIAQQHAYDNARSYGSQMQMPPGPLTPGGVSVPGGGASIDKDYHLEPVSSSAFFIRNDTTGKELLIFGDIEPDSVSMSPRNHVVWNDAAPKIAQGTLKALFIECSYDDSVRDQDLYGHLCPRHLITELTFLANSVMQYRDGQRDYASPDISLKESDLARKRKRGLNGESSSAVETGMSPRIGAMDAPSPYVGMRSGSNARRKTSHGAVSVGPQSPQQHPVTSSRAPRHVHFPGTTHSPQVSQSQPELSIGSLPQDPGPPESHPQPVTQHDSLPAPGSEMQIEPPEQLPEPLKGLTVHIIHVKDNLSDGPSVGEIVLEQLKIHASEINLGCEFNVTEGGESIWV